MTLKLYDCKAKFSFSIVYIHIVEGEGLKSQIYHQHQIAAPVKQSHDANISHFNETIYVYFLTRSQPHPTQSTH